MDVLPSHPDHVAAPLRGVEQERKREPRLAADWVMRLELRDLGIGPSMVTIRFYCRQFDPLRGVLLDQAVRLAVLHERADCLEPVARRKRLHLIEQGVDKLARQKGDALVAVRLTKPLKNCPPHRWRAALEAAEGERSVIPGNRSRNRAGFTALASA